MKDLIDLLHERIKNNCLKQLENNEPTSAAREALIQVECALKEKGIVQEKIYGVRLINHLFSNNKEIQLVVPFGDQESVRRYFIGTFAHYRNYLIHNSIKITQEQSMRILIIASELLDLINASRRQFMGEDTFEGLIKLGIFHDKNQIFNFLQYIDGQYIIDDICDGFYEDLAEKGYSEEQMFNMIELGLLEYKEEKIIHTFDEPIDYSEYIGTFHLTYQGMKILEEFIN